MITAPLIDWQPIATIPDDRKDGRQLLLAESGRGGWSYHIASWGHDLYVYSPTKGYLRADGWKTTETLQSEAYCLHESAPTHWADINAPE